MTTPRALLATALLLSGELLLAAPAPWQVEGSGGVADSASSAIQKQKNRPFWFSLRTTILKDLPFVYEDAVTIATLDDDGRVKESKTFTQEFMFVDGVAVENVLEINGVPPTAEALKNKDRENQRRLEASKRRSESDKAKISAAAEQRQHERRLFWDEFMRAFRFTLVEHKNHNARSTSVIAFIPDPQYRSRGIVDTMYFPRIRGQVWVDDAELEIARLEIEFLEDVASGFGLLGRVYAGTRYYMELAKQIDGLWLPSRAETELHKRVLFSKSRERFTVVFRNYRAFSVDVKIR
jgi:hypothetical protein